MFTPGRGFNASGVGNLRAFLQRGYQLRYVKPMECRGCEASGGRCGASLADGSFVCFCSSSAHRVNCSDGMHRRFFIIVWSLSCLSDVVIIDRQQNQLDSSNYNKTSISFESWISGSLQEGYFRKGKMSRKLIKL